MSDLTWTKFGTEFYPKLRQRKLSDAAVRTHSEALSYLYNVEQDDCRFDKDLLSAFAGSREREQAASELVAHGLWLDHGDDYEVIDHADVFRQSLAAQTARKVRDAAAQVKRTARAREGRPGTGPVTGNGTGPVDSPARQADSQTGREEEEAPVVPLPRASGEPWPTVLPPGGSSRENWRIASKGYDT